MRVNNVETSAKAGDWLKIDMTAHRTAGENFSIAPFDIRVTDRDSMLTADTKIYATMMRVTGYSEAKDQYKNKIEFVDLQVIPITRQDDLGWIALAGSDNSYVWQEYEQGKFWLAPKVEAYLTFKAATRSAQVAIEAKLQTGAEAEVLMATEPTRPPLSLPLPIARDFEGKLWLSLRLVETHAASPHGFTIQEVAKGS